MKRRRFFAGLLALLTSCASLAWYYGFLPFLGGPERAGVRHALNLYMLPIGTTINASGVESWTDYIFEADLSVSPQRFESFLTGRHFKRHDLASHSEPTTAYRIDNYQGFPATESWSWSYRPKDLKEGDYGSRCTIYTNAQHDRIFILYTAD